MVQTVGLLVTAALLLLGALPPSLAHDDGGHMENSVEVKAFPSTSVHELNAMNSSVALSQSYFTYPENSTLLGAHVVLMVVAWLFILPVGKVDTSDDHVQRTQLIIVCRGYAESCSLTSRFAGATFFLGRERARAIVGEDT